MKKRLFCLALCLLLVLPVVLTGCTKKSAEDAMKEITEDASENNLSLTMWVVSDKKIDDATAARINAAVTKITKREVKAALTIRFLTEDEYEATLSKTIRDFENTRTSASAQNSTATVTSSENVLDEIYPELLENQVDIVYIQDDEMYREYVANGWLSALDTELSSTSKKIKEYLSESVLSAAKYQGSTYAIPNNRPVGEYTMMLLNKELMAESSMDGKYLEGKIDGFFNDAVYRFIEDMIARPDAANVIPVESDYDTVLNLLAYYWSINPDNFQQNAEQFSVLGYRYTDPATLTKGTTKLDFTNLFQDETFVKNYIKLNEYRLAGNVFGTATSGKTAAVKFVNGSVADYAAYSAEDSEYYPVIIKYPTASEEMYDGMFGVYTYTRDLSRSMKIVTMLTTDASFRNLIQYGVLGEDYEVIEVDGVKTVKYLTQDYRMDVFKTGNTFIAYPTPAQDADIWKNGTRQNLDAKVDPLLNFDFAAEAKTVGVTSSSTPTLNATGYVYSMTTGYNKAILSQDAFLKAWIADCDAKADGVYVLNTSSTSGQNTTSKVYFYNKGTSNVTVTATAEAGVLTVNYAAASGTSATPGYEITVIDSYAKKNSALSYAAKVGGNAVTVNEKKQNALINFDFFTTDTYQIVATSNVTKAMIADNTTVLNWVKSSTGNAQAPAIMAAKRTVGEKTYYTYLVYAKTAKEFTVNVQPSGDDKNLNLKIDCVAGSAVSNVQYVITVVNIMANNDVAVTLNCPNATVDNLVTDPKLTVYGNLDTAMVKYFSELSKNVENKVRSCTTVAEIKALVANLQVLFKTQDISKDSFDVSLYNSVPQELIQSLLPQYTSKAASLELLNWYLLNATSTTGLSHMGWVEGDESSTWKALDTDSRCSEAYATLYSPYAVYFAWLKANSLAK